MLIVGHIPPGFILEFQDSCALHRIHNDQLVDIMNMFSDVVLAGIFGHEHTDSFRVLNTHADKKKGWQIFVLYKSLYFTEIYFSPSESMLWFISICRPKTSERH